MAITSFFGQLEIHKDMNVAIDRKTWTNTHATLWKSAEEEVEEAPRPAGDSVFIQIRHLKRLMAGCPFCRRSPIAARRSGPSPADANVGNQIAAQ